MSKKTNQTVPQRIKILKVIHFVLCLGLVGFAIFTYVQQNKPLYGIDQNGIFVYLVPITGLMGYFLGNYLFQRTMSTLKPQDDFDYKIDRYQFASLVKYALLEAPAFLAFFAYFENGNMLYLAVGGSLALYLIYERPKEAKIKAQLPLTPKEKQIF